MAFDREVDNLLKNLTTITSRQAVTKFRSFALDKRNEKMYRKPHHTLLNTALERLDPQAEQKVNYDISPGSLTTLTYFRFMVLLISQAPP